VFLFYSMFGFQRVGDLLWALGDMRGRGILAGCTAGRTTLLGEGLQHDDGQSPLLASTNPAAVVYDPAFAYEVAIVVEDAVRRMMGPEPEDRFWYLTLYNENYPMPPLPEGPAGDAVREGVVRGLYRYAEPSSGEGEQLDLAAPRASICFSGPMWRVAMEARRLLAEDWGVSCDCWSATSWGVLRNEAVATERWNRLHPSQERRVPYVTEALGRRDDPVVAVTDYMRAVPDQIARWVDRPFTSLGTDGFGRSDARAALRRYFEVDAPHVVVAVLDALAAIGKMDRDAVAQAVARYGVDPEAPSPLDL
jgi:pyruvate dehydrogenase E1 component